MFQSTEIMLGLYKPLLWLAQITGDPSNVTPAQASALVSRRAFCGFNLRRDSSLCFPTSSN